MKISEIYNSTELNKTIVETKTEDGVTTTYYGVAKYPRPGYSNDEGYRGPDDQMKPIWRIRRSTYDSSTGEYDYSYPNGNVGFCFKWSDRETLPYDGGETEVVHILLENGDFIITENGDRIILG